MNKLDLIIDTINLKSQKVRQKLFLPIIAFLSKIGIKANTISIFKIVPAIFYIFLIQTNPIIAFLIIFFGVVLDFFDGPLARYANTVSDRGKFIDMLSDYIIYACFVFGLIIINSGDVKLLSYNIIIMPILYLLIILNKNENKKTDWIIHPEAKATFHRIIIEISALCYLLFKLPILYFNYILFFANILATIHATFHFFVFIKKNNNHQKC
ncbi:MAG: CDP-alcohol phosphatidyltransferase family protein [Patescibacteria group bacterium]|nr:CDP-alcohol phosphatidyltransferase family protein [Patescibacteria group bacterium]MDD4303900.1 CDP-alcohol phosphatidyltransferase family protein [Patescibacteria group bacterium]MDD4695113.1 CDP-alcohol phosphatidyltransferase family protein [Patescibacteria group bacterium]